MNSKKPVRVAQIMGKLCAGGVESVVFNYYRNMDHDRIQFDFYYDADSTVEPPQELVEMGARFIQVPPYQKMPAYLKTLRQAFRENQYRIVHAHLNTMNVFPLSAAKAEAVPYRIAHNHSTAGKGETKKNILKDVLRPFATCYPTQLFSCSQVAGRWLYGEKPFRVLNNAIDLNRFRYREETRQAVRRELGLEDQLVIGHVGRFCPAKNHAFLIEAFDEVHRLHPESVLLLIGTGSLEPEVQKTVQKLGLADHVRFLGVQEDTSRFYQAMDVFVLPSRYEGLGVVLIEAQASSLPVVCSTEVPEEAKVLPTMQFVDLSAGPKVWAKKILQAAEHSARHDTTAEMRAAGFDIHVEAEKLERFYLKLLAEKEQDT